MVPMCAQELMKNHNEFKSWIGDADKEFESIVALMQEVHRICDEHGITSGYDNPYTSLTNEVQCYHHHHHLIRPHTNIKI